MNVISPLLLHFPPSNEKPNIPSINILNENLPSHVHNNSHLLPPSHGNQTLHLWVDGTTHIIMIGSRKIGSINKASSPARESICGSTTFNKWRCQRGVCHMSAEMRRRRNLGKCWKNIWNGPLICTGLYHSRHFEVKAAVLLIILSMALFCSGAPETKAA